VTDPADANNAWTDADLSRDVHAASDKPEKVRAMFAAIARSYDLNNRVHSLWRDQAWRRYAVKVARVQPGEVVVDVACGTGDLTRAFAERTRASRVLGLDFTPAMLDLARAKPDLKGAAPIEYRAGDAMNLDLPDASADVLSIAFGIRNVADPARAIREFRRVLKPGGRLVILEFDKPRNALVRRVSDLYTGWIMPRTATLISRDKSGAYRYLPKSVEGFMNRDELGRLIESSGFERWTARGLSLGICVCHVAFVPRS
jgi:demethylmenaquinone methyltransferase/2-methoxy-6-polyprenyl-1,4-benzoquinol methylase